MATTNRAGLAELRRRLTPLAVRGAEAGANVAREKLGGPGTGVHHSGQPNPSSRQGEYPAEQRGKLLGSLSARPAGPGAAEFGPLDNPPSYLVGLHFKPPDEGGRPFMDQLAQDGDVHTAVRQTVGAR